MESQRLDKVIVLADAFAIHITVEPMRAMGKYGFSLVLHPASLTWLLLPLDAQAFVRVKRFLRERYAALPLEGAPTNIVLQALRDVVAAMETFFVDTD